MSSGDGCTLEEKPIARRGSDFGSQVPFQTRAVNSGRRTGMRMPRSRGSIPWESGQGFRSPRAGLSSSGRGLNPLEIRARIQRELFRKPSPEERLNPFEIRARIQSSSTFKTEIFGCLNPLEIRATIQSLTSKKPRRDKELRGALKKIGDLRNLMPTPQRARPSPAVEVSTAPVRSRAIA